MGRNADDLGAVFGIWGKETAVDNFVLSGPGFHVDEGGLVTLLEPSRDVIVAREVLFLDRSDFLQLLAAFPQRVVDHLTPLFCVQWARRPL